ncbi:ATP-binding protein [Brevibacillus sp. B_LB10_24]|uniref:sensor histidine kinase n=1 Tax=Brevibacillus sp. B_LB10_24 TaxID=3380645 RepID=UPI0038BE1477
MNRLFPTGITQKYIAIFLAVFLVPTIIIYQLIIGSAKEIMENDIVRKNAVSADALVKRLNKEITDIVLQLQLILGQGGNQPTSTTAIYNRAKQAITKSSFIQSIYYLDLNHKLLFEAPFQPRIDDLYYDYPEFDEVKWSKNYVVTGLIRNFQNDEVVTVSIPVFYQDQKFQGVLIAEFSQDYLSNVLRSINVSTGGFSFLLDQKGKVIASTSAREVGKSYELHPVAINLAKGSSGTLKENYQGEPSIIAYQPLRDNWGLGLGVPEKIAFQPVSTLSVALQLGFTGIFVLLVIFIFLGVRHILYPIVKLTRFAQNFENPAALQEIGRVKGDVRDELGILMKAMVSMRLSIMEKQRMLEDKERFLHDVLEGIPYSLVTIDNQGIVTYLNQRFAQLTGFDHSQIQGRPLSALPIKEDQDDFVLLQSLHTDQNWDERESYIIDTTGSRRIVRIVTSKFYNERQESIGLIAVLQDISQLKLMEEHIKQSEKLALIGEITTGIAHELKNPLAVLSSTSELLCEEVEENRDGQTIRMLIKDTHEEIRRMSGIVVDFLSFARTKEDAEERIEMHKVIDRVLHLLRIKVNEAKVQVQTEYRVTDRKLMIRPNRLMQVYLNLFLNSLDAMSDGGTLRIVIDEQHDEKSGELAEWLIVVISDTGHGIVDKDLEWMFNPFFSTKENGSGLGLTIARDIVREHGGEMVVESEAGKGTTITCKFPLIGGKGKDYE